VRRRIELVPFSLEAKSLIGDAAGFGGKRANSETFYSFEAGPDGLHFLNFRPCKDISYILPETAKPAA